jgi:hypothetical protein
MKKKDYQKGAEQRISIHKQRRVHFWAKKCCEKMCENHAKGKYKKEALFK